MFCDAIHTANTAYLSSSPQQQSSGSGADSIRTEWPSIPNPAAQQYSPLSPPASTITAHRTSSV